MGQKSSRAKLQSVIQLIHMSQKLNLYSIPENYQDFESIAYNFYYAYSKEINPFEYLIFTFSSRGFLKQNLRIKNKKTYKRAVKFLTGGLIHVQITVETNIWLKELEFKNSHNEDLENAFNKIKEEISEDSEEITGVFEAYSKLLKVSSQFCQYITAHNMQSSVFGLLMVIAADSCKSSIQQRFAIIDTFPYIDIKSDTLSEASSDIIRVWNDFTFYFTKASSNIQKIIMLFESIVNIMKSLSAKDRSRSRYTSNKEKVKNGISVLKIIQNRLKLMEEQLKEYSISLSKNHSLDHIFRATSIVSSCGAYGIENLMNLFAITPINKFPLN
ncbi:hypothetical protein SteCoe_8016 [Stentor coeruleus]|uniref:Uncharacterized protein n=1 Tax=Stentor coeruleus TaxID=5963 RepID=A0A1R2CL59_9CILI|nr:hypothetical protein SteCoe_8016 [Stentor coeruleus]